MHRRRGRSTDDARAGTRAAGLVAVACTSGTLLHAAAHGSVPSPALVLLLAAGLWIAARLLLRRRRSAAVLLLVVVAAQAGLHGGLSFLSFDHHAAAAPATTAPPMLAAHAAAALLSAAWLAAGDRLVATLAGLVSGWARLSAAFVRPLASAPARPVPAAPVRVDVLRDQVVGGSVRGRAPPMTAFRIPATA